MPPTKSIKGLVSVSDLRARWGQFAASVRAGTPLAVKGPGGAPDIVLVPAKTYDNLVRLAEQVKSEEEIQLDALRKRFDKRLAVLNAPGARADFNAALNAREWPGPAPKAGKSF